jgi:hypothetical protein
MPAFAGIKECPDCSFAALKRFLRIFEDFQKDFRDSLLLITSMNRTPETLSVDRSFCRAPNYRHKNDHVQRLLWVSFGYLVHVLDLGFGALQPRRKIDSI